MTTIEDLERIKPLFKDNDRLYRNLIYQILTYDKILEIIPIIPADELFGDYHLISKYVSKEDYYNNNNEPWDLLGIIQNRHFTLNDILIDDRFIPYYSYLIFNPNITIQQLIDNNLLIEYHIKRMGYNPNVTITEFIKYKEQILNMDNFSEELIEYILENKLYDNIFLVMNSRGLTYKLYLKYKHIFANYNYIVYKFIELSDIEKFSKKCLVDYGLLSGNKNLTIDYIAENMCQVWDLIALSYGYFIKQKENSQSHLQLQFVD